MNVSTSLSTASDLLSKCWKLLIVSLFVALSLLFWVNRVSAQTNNCCSSTPWLQQRGWASCNVPGNTAETNERYNQGYFAAVNNQCPGEVQAGRCGDGRCGAGESNNSKDLNSYCPSDCGTAPIGPTPTSGTGGGTTSTVVGNRCPTPGQTIPVGARGNPTGCFLRCSPKNQWVAENCTGTPSSTFCPWVRASGEPCCPKGADACTLGSHPVCIDDPFIAECVPFGSCSQGYYRAKRWWPNTPDGTAAYLQEKQRVCGTAAPVNPTGPVFYPTPNDIPENRPATPRPPVVTPRPPVASPGVFACYGVTQTVTPSRPTPRYGDKVEYAMTPIPARDLGLNTTAIYEGKCSVYAPTAGRTGSVVPTVLVKTFNLTPVPGTSRFQPFTVDRAKVSYVCVFRNCKRQGAGTPVCSPWGTTNVPPVIIPATAIR